MSCRETILAKIHEIPALPSAAVNVLRLAHQVDVGIAEVMAAVEYDPGLTTNVLRLANSAYFAGPRKIGSLIEAGVLLGTRRIAQLALSAAVLPFASHPVKGYDLPAGAMIDQMIATAIGAELLAKELSVQPPVYTFTAGLLHNVGKIILGSFVEVDVEVIRSLAFNERLSFEVAEERILGIGHPEAGAALLKCWNLPDIIVDVARWYRDPDSFSGDKMLLDLVHVADNLTKECGLGIGVDGLNYSRSAGAVERLRLTPKLMERVGAAVMTNLESIKLR